MLTCKKEINILNLKISLPPMAQINQPQEQITQTRKQIFNPPPSRQKQQENTVRGRGLHFEGLCEYAGRRCVWTLVKNHKFAMPLIPYPPCYTSILDCEGRSGNGRFESRLSIKLFARALSSPSIST